MRYARLELEHGNIDNARAIFERALSVDYSSVPLWHRYAQTEILAKQFEHAVAVLKRATELLPYQPKLWFTYAETEEMLGNIGNARKVLERWSDVGQGEDAWHALYSFEKRHNGDSKAVLMRWTAQQPDKLDAWLRLAEELDERTAFGLAIDANRLSKADRHEIFTRWINFEIKEGESARARSLSSISGIDINDSREMSVTSSYNGSDIDVWWAEINHALPQASAKRMLRLFEDGVERCKPLSATSGKTTYWKKYALLWLRFALYTETHASGTAPKTVYERALSLWPHTVFTSATLWRNYALYELRNGSLDSCRRILGSALGKTRGNFHIFEDYISLEKRLLATDRVRTLYARMCESFPNVSSAWINFALFEGSLDEFARARAIFFVAAEEEHLDDHEALWKTWAEFEADHGEFEEAREIWEKAIASNPAGIVDMWVQYALFEVSTGLGDNEDAVDEDAVRRARNVFSRGFESLKSHKNLRIELFEMFMQFEETYGTPESAQALQGKAPQAITKSAEDGTKYTDYEFIEAPSGAVARLLANAQKWKQQTEAV